MKSLGEEIFTGVGGNGQMWIMCKRMRLVYLGSRFDTNIVGQSACSCSVLFCSINISDLTNSDICFLLGTSSSDSGNCCPQGTPT